MILNEEIFQPFGADRTPQTRQDNRLFAVGEDRHLDAVAVGPVFVVPQRYSCSCGFLFMRSMRFRRFVAIRWARSSRTSPGWPAWWDDRASWWRSVFGEAADRVDDQPVGAAAFSR